MLTYFEPKVKPMDQGKDSIRFCRRCLTRELADREETYKNLWEYIDNLDADIKASEEQIRGIHHTVMSSWLFSHWGSEWSSEQRRDKKHGAVFRLFPEHSGRHRP